MQHVLYSRSGAGTTQSKSSDDYENQTLTILDARKANPGSFSETGFTLIKLDKVELISIKSRILLHSYLGT